MLLDKLRRYPRRGIGIPSLLECAIVLSCRLRRDARGDLAQFLIEAGVSTIGFTQAHYPVAMDAFLRFGSGRHPAHLNFGDCMASATAKVADLPLLFVGTDFEKTDVAIA